MNTYLHLFYQSPSLVFSSRGKFWGWMCIGLIVLLIITVFIGLALSVDFAEKDSAHNLGCGTVLLVLPCLCIASCRSWYLAHSNYGLTAREARYRTAAIQKAHREYPYVVTITTGDQANDSTTTHHYLTRKRPKHGAFYAYQIKLVEPADPLGNTTDNKTGEQIKLQTIGERTLPVTAQHISVHDSTSYLKHKVQKTTDWMRKEIE